MPLNDKGFEVDELVVFLEDYRESELCGRLGRITGAWGAGCWVLPILPKGSASRCKWLNNAQLRYPNESDIQKHALAKMQE